MYRRPSAILEQEGKFCSRACRNAAYPATGKRGPNPLLAMDRNPAWKGGVTYKRNKGNYVGPRYTRCPPEFSAMARADGYVMEHRLVMAMALGRCLTRTEVVHHRDHDTRNNGLENLQLFPDNGAHKRAEALEKCAPYVVA
jgi:hypothetical protein